MDKFYTNKEVAEDCVNIVKLKYDISNYDIIEPSAGSGNFLDFLPNYTAFDIYPEDRRIVKLDFLTYKHITTCSNEKKVMVIGNPPFGRVSSLAIKFFNHASVFADVIAFIVPRTFRKVSVHNKLNSNFHLIHDTDIPPNSFTPNMQAKCCFQIWECRAVKRDKISQMLNHHDWEFLAHGPKDDKNQPTPPQDADFAIRCAGKCGEICVSNLEELRPKCWHWIKSKIDVEILKERFYKLDFSSGENTARQGSIGKSELVALYIKSYARS